MPLPHLARFHNYRRIFPVLWFFRISCFSFSIALMLYAGLRTEEACALHWEDVDLENDLLHIQRKIIIDHGNTCREVRSTKSRTLRTVPIPRALHDILSSQSKQTSVDWVVIPSYSISSSISTA